MALIDKIRTSADAIEDLASWANDFNAVADPLRRAARVMAAMAAVMAQVIETQSKAVQQTSNRMNVLNDILKQVNEGLSRNKDRPETAEFRWMVGTQEELQTILDILVAEGVSVDSFRGSAPQLIPTPDPDPQGGVSQSGLYMLVPTRRTLTEVQSKLQISLDALSSSSQSDQARVQTTLGRYNATFDLVSSLIKKSETQGDTVSTNLKT